MTTGFLIKYLSIAGGLTAASLSGMQEKPCKATIEHFQENQMDVFRGVFVNHLDEAVEGRYTLDAIREGTAGRSVSRQSGKFKTPGKQQEKLSRVALNIDEQDTWKVVLKIYAQDMLLCADSIVVGNGH